MSGWIYLIIYVALMLLLLNTLLSNRERWIGRNAYWTNPVIVLGAIVGIIFLLGGLKLLKKVGI